MTAIAEFCRGRGITDKVIVEMCKLDGDDAAKRRVCDIALEARPAFLKTSTGRSFGGAKLADVELMSRGPRRRRRHQELPVASIRTTRPARSSRLAPARWEPLRASPLSRALLQTSSADDVCVVFHVFAWRAFDIFCVSGFE